MRKKLRLEDTGNQAGTHTPAPRTEVKIAIDLSRTKWVYCVRWDGEEKRRLTTPAEIKHVQALVAQYQDCSVHIAFEACGFGYEIAWWAREQGIAVTVIAPSRMERAPGLQVKTDRIDVGKMVRKLEQGELKAIYVPARTDHEKRQVVRTYGQALKERKRAQNRIRSLMQEHGRLGPMPSAGWNVYRQWLETQQLPEEVKLCVAALTPDLTQCTKNPARLSRSRTWPPSAGSGRSSRSSIESRSAWGASCTTGCARPWPESRP